MSTDPHPLEQFFLESRLARIDGVLRARSSDLVVVLDGVQNPHNISAVLRSADAFGLQKIFLVGESFTYARGISLGTEHWLTIERLDSAESCAEQLLQSGFRFVMLQAEELTKKLGATSTPVHQLPFDTKLALVFGNEHRGVSPAFQERAHLFAHIPMVGFVESLNISVAAAITFFSASISGRPTMGEEEREALRDQWLRRDLRGGEQILEKLRLRSVEEPPK